MSLTPPRVFLSYAWEDDEYRKRVEAFATRLCEDGINARLDAWHVTGAVTIPEFMSSEVRHAEKVLLVCSPKYAQKIHAMEDGEKITGSGWEHMLVTSAIWTGLKDRADFVVVVFRGTWRDATPTFASGLPSYDLTDDETFETQYMELRRRLTGQTKQAPPIGKPLTGLTPAPVPALRGISEIEPQGISGAKDTRSPKNNRRFRVALSFPGEHRMRVEPIADLLGSALGRSKVLYDRWHEVEFARPNLDIYLPRLYHQESDLVVFFLSSAYREKEWCGLEWRAGRDLLKKGQDDRLMLLRLDTADIDGLYGIDGYIRIDERNAEDVASLILKRLDMVDLVDNRPEPPRVYLSYAPQSESYRDQVKALATRLRADGVNARLDSWHAQGLTVPEFKSRETQYADRILILCSPDYRRRLDATEDGTEHREGWEHLLFTEDRRRLVFALFEGEWKESAPEFVSALPYVDLRPAGDNFESNYRKLLRQIAVQPEKEPSLGALPEDLNARLIPALRGKHPQSQKSRDLVFISYGHGVPDQELAVEIHKRLKASGVDVFSDIDLGVGAEWASEIQRNLTSASHFVVLLSNRSSRSDMVSEEIRQAYQQAKAGLTSILPVRFTDLPALPYHIAAMLNPLQYIGWTPGEDMGPICDAIIEAIEGRQSLPEVERTTAATASIVVQGETLSEGAPLPAADPRLFFADAGAVGLNSPFYVRRAADSEIEEHLKLGIARTIVIRGARQTGKTSILSRVHAWAQSNGCRSWFADFQELDDSDLVDLPNLMRRLARMLQRSFETSVKVGDVWDDSQNPKQNFAEFVNEAVLKTEGRIIFCLDEVDRVFERPFCDDFFAGVRNWHNRRATSAPWGRLSLVLTHSSEPTQWIQNINQSPFNVADLRTGVDRFSEAEIRWLNQQLGTPLQTDGDFARLQSLVGGQPYLVRQALYTLKKEGIGLDAIEAKVAAYENPFAEHLRHHLLTLQREPHLAAGMRRVIDGFGCQSLDVYQRLHSAGLVTGDTPAGARVRCAMYEQYLKRYL